MDERERRRAAIRDLLLEAPVRSQEELQEKLARRGFSASQPVLSRDLRALDVAKQGGVYQVVETERVTPLEQLQSLLRGVDPVAKFLLVACEPGAASAVARALEAEELDGLVGTIAGDDTVLVAVDSESAAKRVRTRIRSLL
jgi:transcriptional regulator of arginine metabolism